VETVLVTRAIIGSFLSFSNGVWYSLAILSDRLVFCLRICATLSPKILFLLCLFWTSYSSSSVISTGCTLGARFQRLLPVAYSEIWYSGSGWFWSNIAIAASSACIVLMALGYLEILFASSLFCCRFLLILARASSRCA
jgi:hypothetical protein